MRTFTKFTTTALLAGIVGAAACRSELDGQAAAVVEEAPASAAPRHASTAVARTLELDPATSRIEFVGAKVTADHRGSFKTSTGRLEMDKDGNIVGMEISVDTRSVEIEPDRLEQHLRNADFLEVEKFPEARFRLAEIEGPSNEHGDWRVTGDLEIRGITKRITFPATARISDERVSADASFKIDRKDFGIVYAGMADDLIKDEVLLELKLEFRRAASDRS